MIVFVLAVFLSLLPEAHAHSPHVRIVTFLCLGAGSRSRLQFFCYVALRVYLYRFEQLLETHTIFSGVTYVDAHVMLTGMLVICAALVLGAGIAVANAVTVLPGGRKLVVAVVPAVVCFFWSR